MTQSQEQIRDSQRPLALKPEDAFRMLGISRSTGYRLLANNTIKSVHLGPKRVLVPMAELDRLLAQ